MSLEVCYSQFHCTACMWPHPCCSCIRVLPPCHALLQSITFTPAPNPPGPTCAADMADMAAAAQEAGPSSGVRGLALLAHAVFLTCAFACLTALQLGGAAPATNPPFLHWKFRVCGSTELEFGCIPLQLQVGAGQGLPVQAACIPTLSALRAGQPEQPEHLCAECLQPAASRCELLRCGGATVVQPVPAVVCRRAATEQMAVCLQEGSALQLRIPLMEGSLVEMLLRQGRLHIIVTKPDLIMQLPVAIRGPIKLAISFWPGCNLQVVPPFIPHQVGAACLTCMSHVQCFTFLCSSPHLPLPASRRRLS